ncbi:hypothetical protein GCM10022235_15720 [Kribbella ginsengisoli]|uniref:Uncharacterized protein n=1 Tax=Kribbella ginsengisoli TaxID=363865 RepID=A0ABP6WEG5_9ACTN
MREKAEHRTTTKRLRYQDTVTAGGERYPLLIRRGTVDHRMSESALILGRPTTPVNTQPLSAFRRLICPPTPDMPTKPAIHQLPSDPGSKSKSKSKNENKREPAAAVVAAVPALRLGRAWTDDAEAVTVRANVAADVGFPAVGG